MTSQGWLTPADSSRSVWWHYMVVVVPEFIEFKKTVRVNFLSVNVAPRRR